MSSDIIPVPYGILSGVAMSGGHGIIPTGIIPRRMASPGAGRKAFGKGGAS